MLLVDCCVLFVVCCLLFAVCCLLFVVCFLLCVVCCLFVVLFRCLCCLFVVVCFFCCVILYFVFTCCRDSNTVAEGPMAFKFHDFAPGPSPGPLTRVSSLGSGRPGQGRAVFVCWLLFVLRLFLFFASLGTGPGPGPGPRAAGFKPDAPGAPWALDSWGPLDGVKVARGRPVGLPVNKKTTKTNLVNQYNKNKKTQKQKQKQKQQNKTTKQQNNKNNKPTKQKQ